MSLSLSIYFLIITASVVFGFQTPSQCSSPQFYNYLTHSCEACPNKTSVASDKTFCNCTSPNYQNISVIGFNSPYSCQELNATVTGSQIVVMHDTNGALNPELLECQNSYPNLNRTACTPCGIGMTYNSNTSKCQCAAGQFIIGQSCFNSTFASNSFAATTLSATLYEKSYVGCHELNDQTSCQILLNICAGSSYDNGTFCTLLKNSTSQSTMPTYDYDEAILNQSLGIYASSKIGTNTTTVKNTLQYVLFQYNNYGDLMDIKPLTQEILPCIGNEEDVVYFQSFGLNLYKTCNLEDMNPTNQYYYDLFVKNFEGVYYSVPIRYPIENAKLYRRFTLLSSAFKANMTVNSNPTLTLPYLNYTTQDTPQFVTQSKSDINLTLLAPFIIFNIFILVVFIINFYKYIKYNPDETNDPYYVFKLVLMFFLFAIKHWGIGLWIWLLGLSAYIFCFFKFQETIYLMMPHLQNQFLQYYDPFLAILYVQFSFVLISIFLLIYDIANSTDYFMIDWEKEKDVSNFSIRMGQQKKQVSVWRKVLLVNQLYELTITNLVNIQFVVLFGLLFLKGLNWINLSYQIPNVQGLVRDNTSAVINPVLAYFIITFVFFIIGVLIYIIRHLFKTWNPLPYQNFVDLCSISNISLIIFDEALHGYYIHGVNPLGQAEGSLQYIDSIFEKQARAFGKSRAFQNDDPDKIQIFQVIFPFTIRQAFQIKYKNRYLNKLMGKSYNTSVFSKPIPEMMEDGDYKQIQAIQNDMLQTFKHYLEGVKTSQFNIKERGFIGKIFSCPQNFDIIGRLPIFYKDFWHEFTNVLMSGHEFIQLINVINFINVFFIATQNIFMAVFIAIIITRLIRLFNDFMIKRNISRNTLIDDKFFN